MDEEKSFKPEKNDRSNRNEAPRGSRVELSSDAAGPQPLAGASLGGDGNNKKVMWLVLGALLLLLIGFGVYAGLRAGTNGDGSSEGDRVFGDLPLGGDREQEPATESVLSGRSCEDPNRRPIGVMLAGDPINRPVSGFAAADQVWELPVLVSGVTRLMAVYQCGRPEEIGSVRSARHDYLFLAEGVDAILGHWGGSYHALNRIAAGEFNTLNALENPSNAYFRKEHIPRPYNGFTTYDRLWEALQNKGYRTTTEQEGYEFKDDAPEGERPSGGTLAVAWPGQFRVSYEYDPASNRYQRYWAGVKQVDGIDNTTPVAPSAVVIMRAANGSAAGPGGYNDVAIEGSGEMVAYQDGQEIRGTWRKDERYKNDRVHFLNEQGEEIVFTRGQVWVMAVDPAISVTWEPATGAEAGEPASAS